MKITADKEGKKCIADACDLLLKAYGLEAKKFVDNLLECLLESEKEVEEARKEADEMREAKLQSYDLDVKKLTDDILNSAEDLVEEESEKEVEEARKEADEMREAEVQ